MSETTPGPAEEPCRAHLHAALASLNASDIAERTALLDAADAAIAAQQAALVVLQEAGVRAGAAIKAVEDFKAQADAARAPIVAQLRRTFAHYDVLQEAAAWLQHELDLIRAHLPGPGPDALESPATKRLLALSAATAALDKIPAEDHPDAAAVAARARVICAAVDRMAPPLGRMVAESAKGAKSRRGRP